MEGHLYARDGAKPHYPLETIRIKIVDPTHSVVIPEIAKAAADIGYSVSKIREIVSLLEDKHFYKKMPAEHPKFEGEMQDVYHFYDEKRKLKLYIKTQLYPRHIAVVIQFKLK